jgi:hypothetical protein
MAAGAKLRPEAFGDAWDAVERAVNPLDVAALTLCVSFDWPRTGAARNSTRQARRTGFITTLPSSICRLTRIRNRSRQWGIRLAFESSNCRPDGVDGQGAGLCSEAVSSSSGLGGEHPHPSASSGQAFSHEEPGRNEAPGAQNQSPTLFRKKRERRVGHPRAIVWK